MIKGKSIERWGRKVTGLRAIAYDSGTAGILFRESAFGQRFSHVTQVEYSCTRAHAERTSAALFFCNLDYVQNRYTHNTGLVAVFLTSGQWLLTGLREADDRMMTRSQCQLADLLRFSCDSGCESWPARGQRGTSKDVKRDA